MQRCRDLAVDGHCTCKKTPKKHRKCKSCFLNEFLPTGTNTSENTPASCADCSKVRGSGPFDGKAEMQFNSRKPRNNFLPTHSAGYFLFFIFFLSYPERPVLKGDRGNNLQRTLMKISNTQGFFVFIFNKYRKWEVRWCLTAVWFSLVLTDVFGCFSFGFVSFFFCFFPPLRAPPETTSDYCWPHHQG